jgi:hypothetical protein
VGTSNLTVAVKHAARCFAMHNTGDSACTCEAGFFGLQCEQQTAEKGATCGEMERYVYISWAAFNFALFCLLAATGAAAAVPIGVQALVGAGFLGACVDMGETQQWAFFVTTIVLGTSTLLGGCTLTGDSDTKGSGALSMFAGLVMVGCAGTGLGLYETSGPIVLSCPSGAVSIGGGACMECPGGLDAPCGLGGADACAVAGSLTECTCPAGSFGSACAPCPAGHFCPDSLSLSVCPAGAFCAEGSTSPTACPNYTDCPRGTVVGTSNLTVAVKHAARCFAMHNTSDSACTCEAGFFGLQCEQQAVEAGAACGEMERNLYISWSVFNVLLFCFASWATGFKAGSWMMAVGAQALAGSGFLCGCMITGETQQWAFYITLIVLGALAACGSSFCLLDTSEPKSQNGRAAALTTGVVALGLAGAGLFFYEDGSPTFTDCPHGAVNIGGGACMECPGGLGAPCGLGGAKSCVANGSLALCACPPGSFGSGCAPCPAGHFCPDSSSLFVCPAGAFCAEGSNASTPCDVPSNCPQGSVQERVLSLALTPAPTPHACGVWDYAGLKCSDPEHCQYDYQLGDLHLGSSCRAKVAAIQGSKEWFTEIFVMSAGAIVVVALFCTACLFHFHKRKRKKDSVVPDSVLAARRLPLPGMSSVV